MIRCGQELCGNWGGDGDVCPCALFDLEPARLCKYCRAFLTDFWGLQHDHGICSACRSEAQAEAAMQ